MPTRPGHPARLRGLGERILAVQLRHLNQEERLEVARECRRRIHSLSVIVRLLPLDGYGRLQARPRRVPKPPRDNA